MKLAACLVAVSCAAVAVPALALAQPRPADAAGQYVVDPDEYMEVVDVEEERPDAVFQLDVALPPLESLLGAVPVVQPSGEWVHVRQQVQPMSYQFSPARFWGGLSAVAGGGWLVWHDVRSPDGDVRWTRVGPSVLSAVFGIWQMTRARQPVQLPVDAVVDSAGIEFQRVFEW